MRSRELAEAMARTESALRFAWERDAGRRAEVRSFVAEIVGTDEEMARVAAYARERGCRVSFRAYPLRGEGSDGAGASGKER